jgi:Protein of unknown function (DUF2442)
MDHEIHRVVSFEKVAPFTLRVGFDDGISQVIDFRPVLKGELYGPLQDPSFFDRVQIDDEVHTLVWPNGADFDPATLHNWPEFAPALKALADNWDSIEQSTNRNTTQHFSYEICLLFHDFPSVLPGLSQKRQAVFHTEESHQDSVRSQPMGVL